MYKFDKGISWNFCINIEQGYMPFDQRPWGKTSAFDIERLGLVLTEFFKGLVIHQLDGSDRVRLKQIQN